MSLKAVFFDAFGTLCEIKNKRETYLPIMKAWPTGIAAAYQALITRNCSPAELAREVGCAEETIKKIKEGVAAEIASMRLYPEVVEVLAGLRQRGGLQWAVVSNLAQPYAEPLLNLLPFTPDACAWSFAVGCRKPEEGLYRYACDQLNVEPTAVLMIGDSWANDVSAPKRLGMRAKYLNRARSGNPPEGLADLREIF